MKASKTVFIVGAGASSEVGIPSGRQFLDVIVQKLNFQFRGPSLAPELGDHDLLDVIQRHYAPGLKSLKSFVEAAQKIREGLTFAKSIDSFIDVHRNDQKIQLLGKLAIVRAILELEQQSALYSGFTETNEFPNLPKLNESWFVRLARGLNDGVRREEIGRIFQKMSIIVFNYDRCVEHFLYIMLQKHYGIDANAAKSAMDTLTVFHPYGKIADLSWQSSAGIPFGFRGNPTSLQKMVGNIRTYTEQVENVGALQAIKSEIENAEALVFLGFSYLDLNMDIIDPNTECAARNVFGTAFGISSSDIEEIEDRIRQLVRRSLSEARMRGRQEVSERLFIRRDFKCFELLDEYSRSLFVGGKRGQS